MQSPCRTSVSVCACLSLWIGLPAAAQESAAPQPETIPIQQLIATVAKKTGKRFLLDPRVRAEVLLIGEDAAGLDYAALLSILDVHGFSTFEDSRYVRVTPQANIRQLPIPTGDGQVQPDAQFVTRVIAVKSVAAPQLVPILRPMLPQEAHLVAFHCNNSLLIVDTFANARRIEKIVQALDTGEQFVPPPCTP